MGLALLLDILFACCVVYIAKRSVCQFFIWLFAFVPTACRWLGGFNWFLRRLLLFVSCLLVCLSLHVCLLITPCASHDCITSSHKHHGLFFASSLSGGVQHRGKTKKKKGHLLGVFVRIWSRSRVTHTKRNGIWKRKRLPKSIAYDNGPFCFLFCCNFFSLRRGLLESRAHTLLDGVRKQKKGRDCRTTCFCFFGLLFAIYLPIALD
ncbi:hypothetical protein HDK64DRAFT_276115, partial [Phyllosticta capitalensis]